MYQFYQIFCIKINGSISKTADSSSSQVHWTVIIGFRLLSWDNDVTDVTIILMSQVSGDPTDCLCLLKQRNITSIINFVNYCSDNFYATTLMGEHFRFGLVRMSNGHVSSLILFCYYTVQYVGCFMTKK